MFRFTLPASLLLISSLFTTSASAHFLFVVPGPGGASASAILSEDLSPDDDIDIQIIAGANLRLKDAAGLDQPLSMLKADHAYSIPLPGTGTRVIHGAANLGIEDHGPKPFLMLYYPKTILGNPFDPSTRLGTDASFEIVPVGKPGSVQFQLLSSGLPLAGDSMTILLPDGKTQKITTDPAGLSPTFTQLGRYGVWARSSEPRTGTFNNKPYNEIRHYPTLVADIGTSSSPIPQSAIQNPQLPKAQSFPFALPQAVASFGAVSSNNYLYVYGGHTAHTHNYSIDAISGQFHRINLSDPAAKWETLPEGPKLQGMNLAAYQNKIYRIGGMEPRNKPTEKTDDFSLATCSRYNPDTHQWEPLPDLPAPRSSHDITILDGNLYAIGGWTMSGDKGGNAWLKTTAILDLNSSTPQWKSIPQPFQRRALIVSVLNHKIYCIGGFDADDEPSRNVDIYDPATKTWSTGPELPKPDMNGFAPAACTLDNRLYVSVGDGSLLCLNPAGTAWEKIATSTPRIVHRLIPFGTQILIAGGADKGNNFNLIESVDLTHLAPAVSSTHQTLCPVMPDTEIAADAKIVEYKGVKIFLCCTKCVKKWNANPAKYADPALLPQLAAVTTK
ncbi:MAG TPA: kelch repeat-containing protein [Tepidisphaeraceae bacterium]|jgi:N-acetylneuraminic acid mutarotase|nr:kelch repeat-containing protein [Tepidisphaeraceae bacterium]